LKALVRFLMHNRGPAERHGREAFGLPEAKGTAGGTTFFRPQEDHMGRARCDGFLWHGHQDKTPAEHRQLAYEEVWRR
jgi:hypothetical protein